jgi:hypothetical protein
MTSINETIRKWVVASYGTQELDNPSWDIDGLTEEVLSVTYSAHVHGMSVVGKLYNQRFVVKSDLFDSTIFVGRDGHDFFTADYSKTYEKFIEQSLRNFITIPNKSIVEMKNNMELAETARLQNAVKFGEEVKSQNFGTHENVRLEIIKAGKMAKKKLHLKHKKPKGVKR